MNLTNRKGDFELLHFTHADLFPQLPLKACRFRLKKLMTLCRNFLWYRDPWLKKVAKVKWSFCTVPVECGGLNIKNIEKVALKMAFKWILIGLMQPEAAWSSFCSGGLKGKHKWVKLPPLTIWAIRYEITPKGSALSLSLWKGKLGTILEKPHHL